MLQPLLRRPPWPLPALFGWLLAWAVFVAAGRSGLTAATAFIGATLVGAAVAAGTPGNWRRALVAGGFPVSALATGAMASVPAWAWLAAAAPLLMAYPLRAWRDAPFFPTPASALTGLDATVSLPRGARVLDAGCGLGHGLQALRRLWPDARFEGVEWSRPLAWACARRCGFAAVRRGDMWALRWDRFDVVYVFQRPESMARVLAKAQAEMAAGSWLVSLEFPVPGVAASGRAGTAGARPVWAYRIAAGAGSAGSSGSTASRARR